MEAPPTPEEPPAQPAPAEDARAARYEAIHDRLFLVKVLLIPACLLAFLLTGASSGLAGALARRLPWPWLVNTAYTALVTCGYSALFFPLEYYQGFVVERRYGLLRQRLAGWLLDYAKALAVSLLLMVLLVDVVYFLLRLAPRDWWLWVAAFYIAFSVVLSNLYPVLIMPLFHSFTPVDSPELVERVRTLAADAGLKPTGLFRWHLGEKTAAGGAALTGFGATRRILLSDTLLDAYSHDEVLSIVAHEVGHYVHRDLWRLLLVGSFVALAAFRLGALALQAAVVRLGFGGVADIGAFPILILCLFLFSLVTMPLTNAYSRRREYEADNYAVRAMRTPEPFVTALEKLARQNLARKEPPPWLEALLHGHPSIARRIRNARRIGADRGPVEVDPFRSGRRTPAG